MQNPLPQQRLVDSYGGSWTSIRKEIVKKTWPKAYARMKDKFMSGRFEPKDAWDHVRFTLQEVNYIGHNRQSGMPDPADYINIYLVCHVLQYSQGWRWSIEVIRVHKDTWSTVMRAITLDEWK